MFIKIGIAALPTMKVTEELLSRAGSPTMYSLSNFPGQLDMSNSDLKSYVGSGILAELIRKQSDDFSFDTDDTRYADEDVDEDDVYGWKISYMEPPTFVRRFEDNYPLSKMTDFISHQMSNIRRQKRGGIREYEEANKITYTFKDSDDSSVVHNESDFATVYENMDTEKSAMQYDALQRLPYLLYRMLMASKESGINIISLAFAHLCSASVTGNRRNPRNNTPMRLVNTGKLYYHRESSIYTDEDKVTNPQDSKLTVARHILESGDYGVMSKYAQEFDDFCICIIALDISFRDDDAAYYTESAIRKIAQYCIPSNVQYMSRSHRYLSPSVLSTIRRLSLDRLLSEGREQEYDPIEQIMFIVDNVDISPANIHESLMRSQSRREKQLFFYNVFTMLQYLNTNSVVIGIATGMPDYNNLSEDGFLLDENGAVFSLMSHGFIPKELETFTSGAIVLHGSGYIIFTPVGNNTLVVGLLSEFIEALRYYKTYPNDLAGAKDYLHFYVMRRDDEVR